MRLARRALRQHGIGIKDAWPFVKSGSLETGRAVRQVLLLEKPSLPL